MKINTTFISLLLSFVSFYTFANNNHDSDKIKIYKSVVKYLSKVQNKDIDENELNNCNDLECIKNKGNKIEGLNNLINKYTDNDANILKDKVYNDLTSKTEKIKGNNGKDSIITRSQKYPNETRVFKNELDNIISNVPINLKESSTTAKIDSTYIANMIDVQLTSKYKNKVYLLLLASLASLLLSIFLIYNFFRINLTQLKGKEINSEQKTKQVYLTHEEIESKINSIISDELLKFKNEIRNQSVTNINKLTETKNSPVIEPKKTVKEEVKPYVMYAKSSFNKAFFLDELKSSPSKECIFELHIVENRATIKISKNMDAINYVFSFNPKNYFSDDLCSVISGDISIAKNVTLANNGEGSAILSSDGTKWEIIKKLELNFS